MSWPLVKLGDLSEAIMGQAPPGDDCNKNGVGTPFVKAGEFGAERPIIREWTTSPLKLAKANDVLLCVVGATCGKINKGADCAIGRSVAAIRAEEEKLDKDYMYYFLSSWTTRLRAMSQGAAQTVINKEMIESLEIPLPPLPEQKRIAAILDKADAIRRKRQQAIQLADDFLRAVFLEMFGDPVTNPKGWDVRAVKEMAKVTTGNTPPREKAEYYGDFIEWIKSDNINTPSDFLTVATEYLSEAGCLVGRRVSAGSTLLTCIAGSFDCIGNSAYADREVSFNQQINALTPMPGVNSIFLYALTKYCKKSIQAASTGGMKGMVSKGKLEEVRFICPPEIMQQKFSEAFLRYQGLRKRMEHSIDGLRDEFSSISKKAFAGEL